MNKVTCDWCGCEIRDGVQEHEVRLTRRHLSIFCDRQICPKCADKVEQLRKELSGR